MDSLKLPVQLSSSCENPLVSACSVLLAEIDSNTDLSDVDCNLGIPTAKRIRCLTPTAEVIHDETSFGEFR